MKLCIQRVLSSSVSIGGKIKDEINKGLLVLFCVEKGDSEEKLNWVLDKVVNLRIFNDENGKMSKSLLDINGDMMIISQFTLAGDCSRGRRPDFTKAESAETANKIYIKFTEMVKETINGHVGTGEFGADMQVSLINDGPVTIIVER